MRINLNPVMNKIRRRQILAALVFILPYAALAETSATKAASTNALPHAQEILSKFVKEIGGTAAFAKVDSQHMTGKCEMAAQGITGKLEVFAKRPDKLVIKISIPGVGDILQGFDGKVG